jgi:hypothetical protein
MTKFLQNKKELSAPALMFQSFCGQLRGELCVAEKNLRKNRQDGDDREDSPEYQRIFSPLRF